MMHLKPISTSDPGNIAPVKCNSYATLFLWIIEDNFVVLSIHAYKEGCKFELPTLMGRNSDCSI